MSDDANGPVRKHWTPKTKIQFAIALLAFYVLCIGPAHWIAATTGHRGFLIVYRPLVHAAEPLGNVNEALNRYVHLFVDSCTAP
jgi:hypothetical protein